MTHTKKLKAQQWRIEGNRTRPILRSVFCTHSLGGSWWLFSNKKEKKNTHEFTTEKNDIFLASFLLLSSLAFFKSGVFVVVLIKFCVTHENNTKRAQLQIDYSAKSQKWGKEKRGGKKTNDDEIHTVKEECDYLFVFWKGEEIKNTHTERNKKKTHNLFLYLFI